MSKSKNYLISLLALLLPVLAMAEPVKVEYTADLNALVARAEARAELPPIAHTEKVTRESYLQTGQIFFKGKVSNADYWCKQPKPYAEMGLYLNFAQWLARMYRLTGNEDYAKLAAQCLESAHRVLIDPKLTDASKGIGWQFTCGVYDLDQAMKKSPAYTEQVRGYVREAMLRAFPKYFEGEHGSFNRPFMTALGAENMLAVFPDAPDAAQWRKYNDAIWNDFWQHRDTDEDSDEYNALAITLLLDWVQVRGNAKEFWSDPGVKKMMERFLYKVSPMGAYPHHPDSMGWNVPWGHYIYIFESCATAYKDGRFKWAAHRLYDYAVNRIEKIESWGYTGENNGWSLLKAYPIVDDTIAETPRDKDVVLLKRHLVIQRPFAEIQRTNQWFDIHAEMMPDKLIFHGGSSPDSMSMMVDTSPNIGHSHDKRPYIVSLSDRGSTLLMALGYVEREPEDHNMPLIRDYEGYPYDNTPWNVLNDISAVKGVKAVDLGAVGYGQVQLGKFFGYPADLDRDIVFIKNVGVLVKDNLKMGTDLRLRWGSQYRVRNLGPDYGANWANTYLGDWVPVRGLGNNSTVLTRWRNAPRDLLIYFLPDKDGSLEVMDESNIDTTRPLPLRVQYTLRQNAKDNLPLACTTLLLPHNPGPGKPLADKVKVYVNEPTLTVIEFTDDTGATHLVVYNTSGEPVELGKQLRTDAKLAYVKRQAGKVMSVSLYGGKQFLVDGKNIAKLAPAAKESVIGE
ncbi:MAG: hypothetical protein ACYDBB_23615 [Armatimonadota bacterium]